MYAGTKSLVYLSNDLPVKNIVYFSTLKGYRFRRCNFVKFYTFLWAIHCIKNQEVDFFQNKSDYFKCFCQHEWGTSGTPRASPEKFGMEWGRPRDPSVIAPTVFHQLVTLYTSSLSIYSYPKHTFCTPPLYMPEMLPIRRKTLSNQSILLHISEFWFVFFYPSRTYQQTDSYGFPFIYTVIDELTLISRIFQLCWMVTITGEGYQQVSVFVLGPSPPPPPPTDLRMRCDVNSLKVSHHVDKSYNCTELHRVDKPWIQNVIMWISHIYSMSPCW